MAFVIASRKMGNISVGQRWNALGATSGSGESIGLGKFPDIDDPFDVFPLATPESIFDNDTGITNGSAQWYILAEEPLDGSFNYFSGGAFNYSAGNQTGTAYFIYVIKDYDGLGNDTQATVSIDITEAAAATATDWATRSTASGVVMATNFDTSDDVFDFAVDDPSHYQWDQTNKMSGNGALRIVIPDSDSTSGWDWWRFLSDDMEPFGSAESGLRDEYWITYSVYMPTDYYNWVFDMASPNHKKFSIISQKPSATVNPVTRSSLDFVGNPFNGSSVRHELVLNDAGQEMIPMTYLQSRGYSARALTSEGYNSNDLTFSNQIDEGVKTGTPLAYAGDARTQAQRDWAAQYGPHYIYGGNGWGNGLVAGQTRQNQTIPYPDPIAGGKTWLPGWNTIKMHVKFPTTWDGSDGVYDFYMHHPGDEGWTHVHRALGDGSLGIPFEFDSPSEQSVSGVPYNGGVDGYYHVGVWLTPYRTGGQSETGVRPSTYLVYDEVIVSTEDIAPPVATTDPPSGEAPAWFQGMSDKQWRNIRTVTGGGATLADVDSNQAGNVTGASEGSAPNDSSNIEPWTSAIALPDHFAFMRAGGHAYSSDNGVYIIGPFTSENPGYARAFTSDFNVALPTTGDTYYPTGNPSATHCYGHKVYIPTTHEGFEMRMCGPYGGNTGGRSDSNAFRFQPDPMDTGGSYSAEGELDSYPNNSNLAVEAGGCDYDPVDECVYAWGGSSNGSSRVLTKYDPITKQWSTISGTRSGTYDAYVVCIDPVRRFMVFGHVGNTGNLYVVDIGTGYKGDAKPVSVSGTNPNSLNGKPGLAYEPASAAIIGYGGGSSLFKLNVPANFRNGTEDPDEPITNVNWTWTTVSGITAGETPPAGPSNGIYGKFRYISSIGALVAHCGVNDDLYLFKVPEGGL